MSRSVPSGGGTPLSNRNSASAINRSWGVTFQGYEPCNHKAGSTAEAHEGLNRYQAPSNSVLRAKKRGRNPDRFLFKIIDFELHGIPQQINAQDLETMHRKRGPKTQIFEDPFFVGLLNQVHSIV